MNYSYYELMKNQPGEVTICFTAAMDPRRGLSTEVFRETFPLIRSAEDSLRLVRAGAPAVIVESRRDQGNDLCRDKIQNIITKFISQIQTKFGSKSL